ncbi:hypothetical protein C5167_033890 [Papaver somniferum]|uniref:CCT domain-containing protein n=1 Tax=Papaver somniferum TaxID=3469 RepID=A0A4Y7KBL5_PAPSO|nr:protein CHLOROPLAST IMPORT APPARATUS 2-like isoform X2 [Papaver somniferum]RZC70753.1 hypothetical protein C5167_033890 [Papaver somniferum]
MSSCLSGGGGRTYSIDLDIVKSQHSSSSTRTTHSSSSPSSTLSESTDSPIKISTRKPRTPRKRPNQTYNEAAALLSTVYPNIFSIKNLKKSFKHSKPCHSFSEESSSELLPSFPPFGTSEFLSHPPMLPENPKIEAKPIDSSDIQSPESGLNYSNHTSNEMFENDFDAESILDEEMEDSSIGIDSIMGNLSAIHVSTDDSYNPHQQFYTPYLGYGGYGFGGISAFRQVDDGDWWRFPTVDVMNISPNILPKLSLKAITSSTPPVVVEKENKKKKKKKKKVEIVDTIEKEELEDEIEKDKEVGNSEKVEVEEKKLSSKLSLDLKLNYDDVLKAWSDRGSPFSEDGVELSESEALARLAQIDLFAENGGLREASVFRYREKRRSRLFSKKIRYQVRKVNADRRPRMKARKVCEKANSNKR